MNALEGRIIAITGAGNGLGRQHALLCAKEGAHVVVNDLGGAGDGSGADATAAQKVVDEIVAAGGQAVAHTEDITSWAGAACFIELAVETFGRLDVLVNNAGILRDGFIHQIDESMWDSVINVHLKGHFAPLHHATLHWKARARTGEAVHGAVINTASASGTFLPNAGQANYGAAKAGIAALSLVAAAELGRIGVRSNAIAPIARTRLTENAPGLVGAMFAKPTDPNVFDALAPENVSPLVAYLATESCQITGKLFSVQGGAIAECRGWEVGPAFTSDEPWTIESVTGAFSAAA